MVGPSLKEVPEPIKITKNNLRDKYWRMNNLYKIVDKEGQVVTFKFNEDQQRLWDNLWYRNLILKSRQLGFTSFACLYFLDECLFSENIEAGIVAHTKPDAQEIFRRKIQFPYDHLPQEIKDAVSQTTDSKSQMALSNGSVINVGVSMRSGTLHYLLVSELGKVAKAFPEKAREIVTGALETVGTHDTLVFIEGTGEGRSGAFYDICNNSQKLKDAHEKLTKMDYRFNFFPWYTGRDNVLDEPVSITKDMADYFRETEIKCGVKLSLAQKAWYIKKRAVLGEDIKREHPRDPEEAFESGIKGTYFREQFLALRQQGRLTSVPYQNGIVVDTWWDLGMNDTTAIWFTQDVGREIHVINYLEKNGEGLEYYRDKLDEFNRELKYRYGRIVAPHDINVRELGTGVARLETARRLGMMMDVAPRVEHKMDSIQKARSMLSICWFDKENCDLGIQRLEEYRKQWDEKQGVYRDKPLHDESSNGADAFQTMAIAHDFRNIFRNIHTVTVVRKKEVKMRRSKGWT